LPRKLSAKNHPKRAAPNLLCALGE
jgi:hypothetical protein